MFMGFKKVSGRFRIDFKLSPTELGLIAAISSNSLNCTDDSEITISDIKGKLDVSMPAISQTLSSLEKKELIRREVAQQDRRKVTVLLTPLGEDVLNKVKNHANDMVDEIINHLGEEDTKELIRIFGRMNEIANDLYQPDNLPEKR